MIIIPEDTNNVDADGKYHGTKKGMSEDPGASPDSGVGRDSNDDTSHDFDEPPPYYTPSNNGSETTSGSSNYVPRATSPAMNFIYVRKLNGALKGRWVLNPWMAVPNLDIYPSPTSRPGRGFMNGCHAGSSSGHAWAGFKRPDSPEDEKHLRKVRNVWLEARNGAIDAEVTMIERDAGRSCDKAVMFVKTVNGAVKFKVHDTGVRTTKIKIEASTVNGAIDIKIPRSFRGVIVLTTLWGNPKLSDEVRAQAIQEHPDGQSLRAFIGEYRENDLAEMVDEISAETRNGHVKVSYDDETLQSNSRFWRFFGH